MTFKTNLPPASCPALAGFSVLAVEGRDAQAFLQSQLMNDVALLKPGQWQWNGWLTPKGRVVAVFALLSLSQEKFWAVLPDFPAAELMPLLQRFVFRSKLSLSVPAVVAAAGPVLPGPARDQSQGEPDTGLVLDFGSAQEARSLYLLPEGAAALAASDPTTDANWQAIDFACGLPRLPADQREAWTPQMLSLERLAAFSLKKGCYPGQEIVARTHYLGQAKRGLARLEGRGLAAGMTVETDGRAVGTIVCASAAGQLALAVLAADSDGSLHAGTGACERLDLVPGLARPG